MNQTIYTSRGLVSTKEGFGKGLLNAARENSKILGIGVDITASVGMNYFAEAFPKRFYSLGIAEQNAVGVAAGLALEGFIPVFSTYGVFSALRPADQIRVSLCYNNLPVLIGGAHAGVSVGPDGATHQALEDLALMRALPNMKIISPCDATQTEIAVQKTLETIDSPTYIRYGRAPMNDFTDASLNFEIGKAQILREGKDHCIIATGHMVWEALQAAYALSNIGIECRVVNMHTIKPLHVDTIIDCAKNFNTIISVEEHQITGGLGSAIAETVTEHCPVKVIRLGMNDSFGESGNPQELLGKYGMSSERIIETIKKL